MDLFLNTVEPIHEILEHLEMSNDYELSRNFCSLLGRAEVIRHLPELEQIEALTGANSTFLYDLQYYSDEASIAEQIKLWGETEGTENILKQCKKANAKIIGNAQSVLAKVSTLIEKIDKIEDLPSLLIKTDRDTIHNQSYFSKYSGFLRDLNTIKKFAEFAINHGAASIYFR